MKYLLIILVSGIMVGDTNASHGRLPKYPHVPPIPDSTLLPAEVRADFELESNELALQWMNLHDHLTEADIEMPTSLQRSIFNALARSYLRLPDSVRRTVPSRWDVWSDGPFLLRINTRRAKWS